MEGEDPSPLFREKSNEKVFSERMKDNFSMFREMHDIDVENINDDHMKFAMQVLTYNLMWNCHKYQLSIGVIVTIEKCVEGVQMNLLMFLVNKF
jgi:hypothetical protein